MTIDPADRAILYSPGNWVIAPGTARTINTGAYLRLNFSGCTCRLLLDTTSNRGPATQFYALIDGIAMLHAANPSVNLTPPLAPGAHRLELVVKAATETVSRWSPQHTVFALRDIALDADAVVSAPIRRAHTILAFGDSVTEGVRVHGTAAPVDVDRNDAMLCWSGCIGPALDAEVGVIGFGGTGISVAGSGGVPAFPSTYGLVLPGHPRLFAAIAPDLVIYLEGQNDPDGVNACGLAQVIDALLTAVPNSRHLVLAPLSGRNRVATRAAIAALASPGVVWQDTSGWIVASDTCDGVHPLAKAHRTRIAPRISEIARYLLPA